MSDDRLAKLEAQVAFLLADRAAYTALVTLFIPFLAALDGERRSAGQPSLIDALDAVFVSQQMRQPPGSHPEEIEHSALVAQSFLQAARDMIAREG